MDTSKIAKITDTTITIETHKFGFCFHVYYEELLLDIFENGYHGQLIEVVSTDGENIEHHNIINFFENLCKQGIVQRSAVTFRTHHQQWNYNFKHEKLSLQIFKHTKSYFQNSMPFNNVFSDAKFIGCLIGRFTPMRFNLAYQLDQAFPHDNFLIFRPGADEVQHHYSLIEGAYEQELDWIKSKKFDTDEMLEQHQHTTSFIAWQKSTSTYHALWPKYQIECVAETDIFSNSWFTEKTARCLASGKPFVLFSGPGSLKTLQNFGFKTFNDIIDESYDSKLTPRSRMTAMFQSLKDLYNDPDKAIKINQLTQIAKYNQSVYEQICRKI